MKVVIIGGVAGGYRFYEAVKHDRRLIEEAFACGMDKTP